MILVFVTCKNKKEAEKIGTALLEKRLAACIVVIPGVLSQYWWPPKKNKIEKSREAILLVKTLRKKFLQAEHQIKKLHSYTVPLIAEIPVSRVNQEYQKWLEDELK